MDSCFFQDLLSDTGIAQALAELEEKGFCCIGPAVVPRAKSASCCEARNNSVLPSYANYCASAPHRFHRIVFDSEAQREFRELERSWLPLVHGFFRNGAQLSLHQNSNEYNSINFSNERNAADWGCDDDNKTFRGNSFYRSECQLIHTAAGAAAQFFHQDNRRRGLTVIVPLVDIYPALGPTQVSISY